MRNNLFIFSRLLNSNSLYYSFLFSEGVLSCIYTMLAYKIGTGSRKSSSLFVIDGWLLFIGVSTCRNERLECVEFSLKTNPARPLLRAQIRSHVVVTSLISKMIFTIEKFHYQLSVGETNIFMFQTDQPLKFCLKIDLAPQCNTRARLQEHFFIGFLVWKNHSLCHQMVD